MPLSPHHLPHLVGAFDSFLETWPIVDVIVPLRLDFFLCPAPISPDMLEHLSERKLLPVLRFGAIGFLSVPILGSSLEPAIFVPWAEVKFLDLGIR